MQNLKSNIKNRLFQALRNKFENYKPETSSMPFHTRLLGKDRMALYSFIQTLNTNFGTSIFEPVAEELGSNNFNNIGRQMAVANTITKEAQRVIQDIMDSLESGNSKPNKMRKSLESWRFHKVEKQALSNLQRWICFCRRAIMCI